MTGTKNLTPRFSLQQMLYWALYAGPISFAAMQLLSPPLPVFAGLYLLGVLSFDVMVPLLNSLSVYYSLRNYTINYGIGRGIGSLAFSSAALAVGHIME